MQSKYLKALRCFVLSGAVLLLASSTAMADPGAEDYDCFAMARICALEPDSPDCVDFEQYCGDGCYRCEPSCAADPNGENCLWCLENNNCDGGPIGEDPGGDVPFTPDCPECRDACATDAQSAECLSCLETSGCSDTGGGNPDDPNPPLSCERLDFLCPENPDDPRCATYEEDCGDNPGDPDPSLSCDRLDVICAENMDDPRCATYQEDCVCSKCDEACADDPSGDACNECLAYFECEQNTDPEPEPELSCDRLDVVCAENMDDPRCATYQEDCVCSKCDEPCAADPNGDACNECLIQLECIDDTGGEEPVDDCFKCDELCADDPNGDACLSCLDQLGCGDTSEPISCEECQRICEEDPSGAACQECKDTCDDGSTGGEDEDAGNGGDDTDAGNSDGELEEAPADMGMVGGGDGCGGCASTSGGDAAPVALLGAAFAGMLWRRRRRG